MASEKQTLVFSFDGTGNEPSDMGEFHEDESISNVLKLHILMQGSVGKGSGVNAKAITDNRDAQRTYYYSGIGTREGSRIPLLGKLIRVINEAFAPSFGDAGTILEAALEDFQAAKYQKDKGDRLVVFGFSRGAALARKFVSLILDEDKNAEVAFLGVFDTVAAMGGMHRKGEKISSDVVFENGTLNPRVERAVHIVSLDEDRVPFTPTLINRDPDNPDRILEVWFPGVHSDIGGGYWFDGLSDSALKFMIEQCESHLGQDIRIEKDSQKIDTLHALKQSSELTKDDVVIRSVVEGVLHAHSGVLAEVGDQEPRRVCVNVEDIPDGNKLPLIYWTVWKRFHDVPGYRPVALRGLKYTLLKEDGTTRSKELEGIADLDRPLD